MTTFFENIVSLMAENYKQDISMFDKTFLERNVAGRMETTSSSSREAYLACLAKDPSEPLHLVESLTNCYSEFFRNTLTFALLEQFLLPKIFKEKNQHHSGEIRIWSAGCSAGQEPYSIAILADEFVQNSKTNTGFTIFATDNSEKILEAARSGCYDEIAIRNVKHSHINRYFTRSNGQYQVTPQIKEPVDFSFYNLLDTESVSPPASIYGDFDLVVCSNVLYYYNQETQKRILGKLSQSLNDGGILITSEAEKSIVKLVRGFRPLATPASVYMKIM